MPVGRRVFCGVGSQRQEHPGENGVSSGYSNDRYIFGVGTFLMNHSMAFTLSIPLYWHRYLSSLSKISQSSKGEEVYFILEIFMNPWVEWNG